MFNQGKNCIDSFLFDTTTNTTITNPTITITSLPGVAQSRFVQSARPS